jgi:hypothetical protein
LLRARSAGAIALAWTGRLESDGVEVDAIELTEGQSKTRISIDTRTRRVRALEYRALSNRGEGKKEEEFVKKTYGDYRPVGEVPFPHRLVEFSDGVKSSELVVTEVEIGVAPDLESFARPEPDEESRAWSDQIAN